MSKGKNILRSKILAEPGQVKRHMQNNTLLKRLKGVKQNESLSPHTTFKIGGPAQYFYKANSTKELIKAVRIAKKLKMAYFILGGGSNTLVSDRGFRGLVITIQNSKLKIQNNPTPFKKGVGKCRPEVRNAEGSHSKLKIQKVLAESGVKLPTLLRIVIENGLSGLEWTVGIPGTIGGAIRGNAGAFNQEIKNVVKRVKILDSQDKIRWLKARECQFSYRNSIFKHKDWLILETELSLRKGSRERSQKLIEKYLKKRKETQSLNFPSAGCIFKNPAHKTAGWLIEQVGLKGKRRGGAQISEKHANFIINTGKASSRDVLALIKLIKKKVSKKFGIELKEEIGYLGF